MNSDVVRQRWPVVGRIGFRFLVVYLGLFCLSFAQITFVFTGIVGQWLPESAIAWQLYALDPFLNWVGNTVFGVDARILRDSGSGDQAAIWVLLFVLAASALVATAVWSVLDRRRPAYPRLAAWFLVAVRLCLGGQMLFYGSVKVIPTQMQEPPLTALLTPLGELSPMAMLWLQVGSAPMYEIALGSAEVLGGLLLFWPRTATLGAMVSLVSMAQVFLLNMTFDVPVKILSFHLLVLAAVLLAPQARRLANVLVLERPAEPAVQPAPFTSQRANRIAALVQVAAGVWVAVGVTQAAWHAWSEWGGGRPKSELYGIWTVTDYRVDGVALPPLTTDPQRWQRLVFEDPGYVTYQLMDGSLQPAPAEIESGRLVLGPTTFTIAQPEPDRLVLTGDTTVVELSLTDLDEFPLHSRGFHWIQDYPYYG